MHLIRPFGKIGGALLFLSFFGIACRKPEPVHFAGYRNIHFSSRGLANGLLQGDLALFNPNPYPLKVKDARLTLLVNGDSLTTITRDSLWTMPARDTFFMPVKLRINVLQLAGKFLQSSNGQSVLLEARGSCKVGRSGAFIRLPLHYRHEEQLQLF